MMKESPRKNYLKHLGMILSKQLTVIKLRTISNASI